MRALLRACLLFVTLLLLPTPAASTSDTANYCAEKYTPSDAFAASLKANSPSALGGNTDAVDYWQGMRDMGGDVATLSSLITDPDASIDGYGTSLIMFAAPGFVLFVLSLLVSPGLLCARLCCSHRCCKPKKTEAQYTTFDRWCPMVSYNVFALACGAISVSGIVAMNQVGSGSTGALCAFDAMIDSMNQFAVNGAPFLHDFAVKFTGGDLVRPDGCDGASPPASCTVSCTESAKAVVANALFDMRGTVDGPKDKWGKTDDPVYKPGTVLGGPEVTAYCAGTPCTSDASSTTCTYDLKAALDLELAKFDAAKTKIVDEAKCPEITSTHGGSASSTAWDTARQNLAERVALLGEKVPEAVDTLWISMGGLNYVGLFVGEVSLGLLANYTLATGELRGGVESIKGDTLTAAESLATYGYVFYSTCFLAVFAGLFAIIAWLTPCKCDDLIGGAILDCSWILSLIFMTVMFLLGGLGMPLAIAYSDVCMVLTGVPNALDTYFGMVFEVDLPATVFGPHQIIGQCFSAPDAENNLFDQALDKSVYDFSVTAATPWLDANSGLQSALQSTEHTEIRALIGPSTTSWSFTDGCVDVQALYDAMIATETLLTNMEAKLDIATGPTGRQLMLNELAILRSQSGASAEDGYSCGTLSTYYNEVMDNACETALGGIGDLVTFFNALAVLGIFLVAAAIKTSINVFGRGHDKNEVSSSPDDQSAPEPSVAASVEGEKKGLAPVELQAVSITPMTPPRSGSGLAATDVPVPPASPSRSTTKTALP